MKREIKSLLPVLRVIGSILGIGLLGFQIYRSRFFLISFFQSFGLNSNFCLSFFSIIIAIIIQISTWFMIMRMFDVRIKYTDALMGYSLAFLPRYIPGTFWGYLSRNEWLSADFGVNRKTSTLGSILELFFISGALIFMVGFHYLPSNIWLYLTLFVLILASETIILHYLQRRPIDLPFLSSNSLRPVPFMKILAVNLSSIGVWFIYGLAIYFLSTNDPIPFSNPNWLSDIFQDGISYSLAWTAGFLVVFVPSGLGVREQALANLISFNKGIALEQAYQIALVFRLAILIAEISLTILGLIFKSLRHIRNSRAGQ